MVEPMTNKNTIIVVLLASLLSVCSFNVFARAAGAVARSGPNPFRDCGIGAALFPGTHWAAVTSNVIWDIGSTAMTSATASPETCSGDEIQAAQFIIDTYDNLMEETAKGQGEHLIAVINILSCDAVKHKDVIRDVRNDMAKSIVSASYAGKNLVEKASDYYIAVDSAISNHCPA